MTTLIPTAVIPEVWPAIEGRVLAALKHCNDTYRTGDVRAALAAGEWQLWGDGRSIACTRIAQYPARRVLFITLASGGLESVKMMFSALMAYAKAQGCDGIFSHCRRGWRRSNGLPSGWQHTHDVISWEF